MQEAAGVAVACSLEFAWGRSIAVYSALDGGCQNSSGRDQRHAPPDQIKVELKNQNFLSHLFQQDLSSLMRKRGGHSVGSQDGGRLGEGGTINSIRLIQ